MTSPLLPASPPPLAAAVASLQDHAPPPPVLAVVRLVCRERLPLTGGNLPHVARLVDAFLDDFSDTLTLARGYLLSGGSLRLLQYLAAREGSTTDPILRRWAFNDVVGCAAAKGDVETLRWLLESYLPDEFLTKAVSEAASNGQLHVLEWLWTNYRSRSYWGGNEMWRALRNRRSLVVTWLRDHTMPRPESAVNLVEGAVCGGDLTSLQWLTEHFDVNTNKALDLAAGHGQWGVARWIVQNCELGAPPGESVSRRAATDGDLDFFKLLISRKIWTPDDEVASSMILSAAAAGHLEVVQWLYENCSEGRTPAVMHLAAVNGHMNVVKWLHANFSREGWQDLTRRQVENDCGDVERVEWLDGNGDVVFSYTMGIEDEQPNWAGYPMDIAAARGYLDVVKWLHENRYEGCTTQAMDSAAARGHFEIVKWLHKNRSEGCTKCAMDSAAVRGHFEIVKWLHDNRIEGCTTLAMDDAAASGHFEIVKWLHENRSEGCAAQPIDDAAGRGYLEIVKWLHENRSEGCTTRAMDDAAARGYLEIVKWLHVNRSEGCTYRAMDRAADNGDLKMVKWLHENRAEGCTKNAMYNAAISNHIKVVKWLCRKSSECFGSYAIERALGKGRLDIVVLLHTKCRPLRLERAYSLNFYRIEVAEWVLEHFPREFKDCSVVVEPGDWHFGDWLERTNQLLVE